MTTNPDFEQSIGTQRLNVLMNDTLNILQVYLKKDSSWHRCYGLKQNFTNRFGYCFQKDFYYLCEAAGFLVKIDRQGDHLVKANWKRSFFQDFPKIDRCNPPYASSQYWATCPPEHRPTGLCTMSTEMIPATLAGSSPESEDWWEQHQPPTDLIFDDGEPLESNRHRVNINVLCDLVPQALMGRKDFFVGGNMFVYYSTEQVKNRDFKGPDFFAVLEVDGSHTRQGWVVWNEGGRYPDVIIELMSPSTTKVDLTTKKDLYEKTFKTSDYFVYNPFKPNSLQGWHLGSSKRYEEIIPNERGWLWCETLGLWVGIWEGTINRENAPWLRLYDRDGHLIPLPQEAERQQAEAERQQAEAERQRAEAEHQRAEAERQRAETERQRAETERQKAENERQKAENERQRAERLAAKLRELGEDPDSF